MSWPYNLSGPPSISLQANQIAKRIADWAEPKGGVVEVMANMRHLWEKVYSTDDKPKLLVVYMGETSRATPDNDTHRVDRLWSVVFMRGHGLKYSVSLEGEDPASGTADTFLNDVETVRDLVKTITSISEEFPVQFKGVKPMPNLAPTPSSNAYLDAYVLEFATANDVPAVTLAE